MLTTNHTQTPTKPATMRFFALAALFSLATAAPSAPVEARDAVLVEARDAVLAETFAWPSSSKAGGNIEYQYQVTPGSGSDYTIAFYNSAASNSGSVYTYTYAAVGTGADTTSTSKTLAAGKSTSFTVQKSGTEVNIVIKRA